MINSIFVCCFAVFFSYISCGIINLKQVKKEKVFVKKAVSAFPVKRTEIIYCSVMLVYMLSLSLVITNVYSGNLCSYIKTIALASLMWPMAYIDKKSMRIPNKLIVLGLIYRGIILIFELLFFGEGLLSTLLLELLAAIGIGAVLMLSLIVVKNGIGMGDIKFFMLMGLFLGVYRLLSSLFAVMIIAFFVALYKLIIKKESRKAEFSFGPAIAAGSLLSFIIFGN